MTLDSRTQALLVLVESDRSSRREALLAEARCRARALLAQAHADARARMREAFAEERHRAHEMVAAAQANLSTRRRLHEQRRAAALLALGWQRLPAALTKRWQDAPLRCLWVEAIVAAAARALPRVPWSVVHSADWPVAERDALGARMAAELATTPTFVADARISAGLRIAAAGNVIDGTLAGLVNDRSEVGAQLLRRLEQSS